MAVKLCKLFFFIYFLENTMFSKKNQNKSYTITDLHLNHNILFGYKDSNNYYDVDVNKILLLKKSNNECFIRYNDLNKKKIAPLLLKIENFYFGELHIFTSGIILVPIYSDDNEFLENVEKCGMRFLN